MKCTPWAFAAVLAAALLISVPSYGKKFDYPPTRTVKVVDEYHGRKVADPYRWLEDDYSDETLAWVKAQNEVTFEYLEGLPMRDGINRRLKELQDYERYSLPFRVGDYYIFGRNDGLQNQSVVYRQKGLDGRPEVLFDPNGLSEDGTTAFTGGQMSDDGRLFVYGFSESGSDWRVMKVRDLETGEDLGDEIRWLKFANGTITGDGRGLFYSRYPEPDEGTKMVAQNKDHMVWYHRIGTDQSEDRLIFEDPDNPDHLFFGTVTEDDEYFVFSVLKGATRENGLYYLRIGDDDGEVVRLLDSFDATYDFVGNAGGTFYVMTNLDAPRFRLLAIELSAPGRESWREVIPEQEDVLQSVKLVGGRLVAVYMHDAANRIRVFGMDGAPAGEVELPSIGSVAGISGKNDSPEMFFGFQSFVQPGTAFRYDLDRKKLENFRSPDLAFDPADFVTEQAFFTSGDGERVPVFLSYRKGTPRDGETPVYLYGYGGFGVSMTPYFDVTNLMWMEMGGIFAMVTARGGGEYGEEWHRAGMLEKRQNVYDDYIYAAEYLIREGYTNRRKLAIGGASNGGLVVGVCMTQRPDLFAVALPDVGVFDMLRYHLFTIGWAWAGDYGRADNEGQFPFLLATSPYHNLRRGIEYPATLVSTADHDDRVVPAHSFKFAARLQACHAGDTPVMIRVETKAGHGGMSGTDKRIALATDQLSFIAENLGMD